MPNYENLGEFFEELDYLGGFDAYKARFFNCTPDQRTIEMASWDKLMQAEERLTRQTAEYINKRRELADIDSVLRRGGR